MLLLMDVVQQQMFKKNNFYFVIFLETEISTCQSKENPKGFKKHQIYVLFQIYKLKQKFSKISLYLLPLPAQWSFNNCFQEFLFHAIIIFKRFMRFNILIQHKYKQIGFTLQTVSFTSCYNKLNISAAKF